MFQGTTIDELIRTVERAEQNSRQQQKEAAEMDVRRFPLHMVNWRQAPEVA